MKKGLVLSLLLGLLMGSASAQLKFNEGADYTVLNQSLAVNPEAGKDQVYEFFWFGCPHCFSLSPSVSEWEANKSSDVYFELMPATGGRWTFAAQAMYVAEKLGLASSYKQDFFNAVHKQGQKGIIFDKKALASYLNKNYDVSEEDFNKAWDSFEVKKRVKRADEIWAASKLDGVPAFVVNGKYIVTTGNAQGSEKRLFEIIDFLTSTTDVEL